MNASIILRICITGLISQNPVNENIELLKSESWLKVKAAEIQQRKEILAAGSLIISKLKVED